MSIQPLSIVSTPAEPAPVRRRAAESERGREPEAFVLPQDDGQDMKAAETRPAARTTDAPAAKDAAETDGSDTPAKSAPPAKDDTAAKPGDKVADKPAETPAAVAKTDVGALVTIAVAAQAQVKPSKEGVPAESDKDKDNIKVDAGDAGAGVTPSPLAPIIMIAMAASPVMTAGGGSSEAVTSSTGGVVAMTGPALQAAAETMAETGRAGPALGKQAVQAQGDVIAQTGQAAGGEETKGADGEIVSKKDGKQIRAHAAVQGGAETSAPAAGTAAPVVEFKPIEALQQALNPIDLSAVTHQVPVKADPLQIAVGLDKAAAQAATTLPGQAASTSPPTPVHMVPIEIGLRALSGARQFDIRLDPLDLGRVDVNLSISGDGDVSARLVVDRVETLHLLQRDARTLERAFEQAGLKSSDGSVQITLRDPSDQSGFRQNRQHDEAPQRPRHVIAVEGGDQAGMSTQPAAIGRFVRIGGVDVSV